MHYLIKIFITFSMAVFLACPGPCRYALAETPPPVPDMLKASSAASSVPSVPFVPSQPTDPTPPAPAAPAAPSATAPASADYLIGCGDVLFVSVWQNEQLSREVAVMPDGKISLPLLGEIVAAGKTVSALKEELLPPLGRYVNDPVVNVSIRAINSMFVYVLGMVNNPGRHALVNRVDVLQALAIAGGLNAFADKGDIRILRREQGNAVKIYHFNYREVIKGRRLEQDILLERGDVIVVP